MNTRPGGLIHLLFIAFVLAQVFTVEICESRLAPFDGFMSGEVLKRDVGMDLSTLRFIAVLIGLAVLGTASVSLWQPHLSGPDRTSPARIPSLLFHLVAKVTSEGVVARTPDKTPFLFTYMSLNAIAVCGLLLFLIDGHRLDFYGFAAPALVGLMLLWTQAGRWDRLAALEQHDLEI